MHRKKVPCAPLHCLPVWTLSAAVRCCVLMQRKVVKELGNPLWLCMSVLLLAVFLLSLRRPLNGRSSVRLTTPLPLLCPHVPSVSLSSPPVGHERAPSLSLLLVLALYFSLLSGGEIQVQPQGSDPQTGCYISDNIRGQIRQEVRGPAEQG